MYNLHYTNVLTARKFLGIVEHQKHRSSTIKKMAVNILRMHETHKLNLLV